MSAVEAPTLTLDVHFRRGDHGRRRLRAGKRPAPRVQPGRIPRVSRLLALAVRFDELIRGGVVRDYADIARLGGVSRARITQVMALLDLAPDIQEAILFLPRTTVGRDPVTERLVRRIAAEPYWTRQLRLWESCTAGSVHSIE